MGDVLIVSLCFSRFLLLLFFVVVFRLVFVFVFCNERVADAPLMSFYFVVLLSFCTHTPTPTHPAHTHTHKITINKSAHSNYSFELSFSLLNIDV